jgi:hypothetical protein
MVRIKNQTEPIENRCGLVRFSDSIFKTDENRTEPIDIYIVKLILFL